MKRIVALILFLSLCLTVFPVGSAFASDLESSETGRYLVSLRSPLEGASLLSEEQCTSLDSDGTIISTTDPNLIVSMAGEDQVLCVEPDRLVTLLDTEMFSDLSAEDSTTSLSVSVNDPLAQYQWHLNYMGADSVWERNLTGSGVRVAVIDSGIQLNHEDFAGLNIVSGYDYTGYGTMADQLGHGTFVTGLLAAQCNNGIGVAGIVDDITVVPLRVFGDSSTTSTSLIVEAIYDAVDIFNCSVINLSVGSREYSYAEELAVNHATQKGALVIAAAGNDGVSTYQYPASLQNAISVGYIQSSGTIDPSSQHNDCVDIVAPGSSLYSTAPYTGSSSRYRSGSGSSFSTPLVSAMAVIAKSQIPDIGINTFRTMLQNSAEDRGSTGYDEYYGWGVVSYPAFLEQLDVQIEIANALSPYNDIGDTWARPYIAIAVDTGLMNGTSENTFSPNKSSTRAMAATILSRLSGDNVVGFPDVFEDVPDELWYTDPVRWAAYYQITKGITNTLFYPNQNISREQLITFLYRFADCLNLSLDAGNYLYQFSDGSQVSSWAQDAVNWAIENGLLEGSNQKLQPLRNITRAEMAAVLVRFANYLDSVL